MAAAVKPLTLADSADPDAAPQPVCLPMPDGKPLKQAANVATSGTVEDVVNALVAAGIMAAPAE